ncbi:hypothetical protein CRYUN_Cryun16bG0003900 [Craigia yunnanensis]
MVFVCFVGLKEGSFSIGRTVLPKFFLQDVGNEGFDMMMKCGGLMEEKKGNSAFLELEEILGEERLDSSVIGISCFNNSLDDQQLFSCCELTRKTGMQALPRAKYPRPLIFHDGRLAFRPTPVATLFMFMWIPFGIFLLIVRATVFFVLPYKFSMSVLHFTGLKGTLIWPSSFPDRADDEPKQGDALHSCFAPIKTVRLTRNREKDSKMIEKQLKQEISDEIIPVAIDFQLQVSMFYGTTASGFKFLDPAFLLMNPTSHYSARILEKLPKSFACQGGKSKFEVANHVQAQISKALNFECTSLTRKDKYMILAGNEGIV